MEALIKHLNRLILPFLTIAVLSSFLFEINLVSAQPFAYVVNQGSNDVSIINTATNDIEFGSPISVGEEPDAIAIAPDGKSAYVAIGMILYRLLTLRLTWWLAHQFLSGAFLWPWRLRPKMIY